MSDERLREAVRYAVISAEPGLPAKMACAAADAALNETLRFLQCKDDAHVEFRKEIARVALAVYGTSKGPYKR